jgi:UTP--glucose-1-phosphate uridylyltransferase
MSGRVRKAVIPAAGLGTRSLPATKAIPKEMMPVVDKPAIQYVVEEAVRAGLTDILVITGRSKLAIEDHFDRDPELEDSLAARGKKDLLAQVRAIPELARMHYIRQGDPLGLGHAVSMAREHVGDEPFAVLLPDDLIHQDVPLLEEMIDAHEATDASSVIALMEVDPADASLYGCARPEPVDGSDNLVRILEIIEKPPAAEAPSNLAVIGRYIFTPGIFAALDRVKPGVGGEIQLTDAVALLLADEDVYGYTFPGDGRYDAGSKLDYLRAIVELATEHPDLGVDFSTYLAAFVKRRGLT